MKTKTFLAKDGLEITYDVYQAKDEKAVLELIHGSVEHVSRYKYFCEYLAKNNITVYAMDLRGHGRSLYRGRLGYFSDQDDGWELILNDMEKLLEIIKNETEHKCYILGHSMGSFLVKDFIYDHAYDFEGSIIMGTNNTSKSTIWPALLLANSIRLIRGKKYRSKMIHKIIYDRLSTSDTKNYYLSHDQEVVEAYNNDDLCGYIVTLDYAISMAKGLIKIQDRFKLENETLKLLFISGKEDPIGGKDNYEVLQAKEMYQKNNPHNDIRIKLYDNMYHEVLNEIAKEKVYNDIINYIKEDL